MKFLILLPIVLSVTVEEATFCHTSPTDESCTQVFSTCLEELVSSGMLTDGLELENLQLEGRLSEGCSLLLNDGAREEL